MNIAMLLEMAAEGAPDRIALAADGRSLTTTELLACSRRAARAFVRRGVDNIALVDANSEAVAIALFGAAIAGLPFVPINYRLTDVQLHDIVARVARALVIVGPDIVGRFPEIDGIEVLSRVAFLDAVTAPADEPGLREREGEGEAETSIPAFVDPDAIAILLFTSGTTGTPKAAVLRHRHLTSYIIGSVEFMGADDDEVQLVSVPPYHIAGVSAALSTLYSGRRIAYLPTFDADLWVDTVVAERVTHAMVVPTMLTRILASMQARGIALTTLRHLSYGGGRMPGDVVALAMKMMPNVGFVNAYGLTETSSTIAMLTPDDHRDAVASADPLVRRRLGSVGRPLPSVEVEIRDADGMPLGADERGEIFVRGEQVAGEYLGRHVLTDDGWFPTNDAGSFDSEGFLYLDGRLDDVIVRGGENLSPGQIEATLTLHPAVESAAVVGVPDAEWGETVAAAVVLKADALVTEQELRQWVRERLRSTKTPVFIRFRADLPYNETGKLLRRVVRDELSEIAATRHRE